MIQNNSRNINTHHYQNIDQSTGMNQTPFVVQQQIGSQNQSIWSLNFDVFTNNWNGSLINQTASQQPVIQMQNPKFEKTSFFQSRKELNQPTYGLNFNNQPGFMPTYNSNYGLQMSQNTQYSDIITQQQSFKAPFRETIHQSAMQKKSESKSKQLNQKKGKTNFNSKQVGTFEFSSKENNQYQKVQVSNPRAYQPVNTTVFQAKVTQPIEVQKASIDTEKNPVEIKNVVSGNTIVEKQNITPDTTSTITQAQPTVTRQKYELCKNWKEKGICRYGEKCLFAHGEQELTKKQTAPKVTAPVEENIQVQQPNIEKQQEQAIKIESKTSTIIAEQSIKEENETSNTKEQITRTNEKIIVSTVQEENISKSIKSQKEEVLNGCDLIGLPQILDSKQIKINSQANISKRLKIFKEITDNECHKNFESTESSDEEDQDEALILNKYWDNLCKEDSESCQGILMAKGKSQNSGNERERKTSNFEKYADFSQQSQKDDDYLSTTSSVFEQNCNEFSLFTNDFFKTNFVNFNNEDIYEQNQPLMKHEIWENIDKISFFYDKQ